MLRLGVTAMVDRERQFCEALRAECARLGVSSRVLAAAAGISESTLSRYCTGLRTPGEKTVRLLAHTLASLSGGASSEDEISNRLMESVRQQERRAAELCRRIDALMAEAHLTDVELARAARVDPSYVSRIRSGARVPADPEALAAACAHLAARRLAGSAEHPSERALLARLLS